MSGTCARGAEKTTSFFQCVLRTADSAFMMKFDVCPNPMLASCGGCGAGESRPGLG
jgi:hypothetical protein